MKALQTIILIFIFSCSPAKKENNIEEKSAEKIPISKKENTEIHFHKLEKKFVTGDFDADGKRDTLIQHNFSELNKNEIDSSPDPFQNEWDAVVKWFYAKNSNVYISFKKNGMDTLNLGTAQGLYCLLNIGDINSDSRDEIAFVVDYFDDSQVNNCKIYSLCKGKWTMFKQFGIHEDAFNFTSDKAPAFEQIKEYLEKKKGKWVYKDYSQNEFDTQQEPGKTRTLKLARCK